MSLRQKEQDSLSFSTAPILALSINKPIMKWAIKFSSYYIKQRWSASWRIMTN